MADSSWIPAIANGIGTYAASQKRQQGDAEGLELQRQLYAEAMKQLASAGYTPQQAEAVLQGQSNLSGIAADPQAVQAQRDALSQLQQASQNGYDDVDRAAINQALNEVAMHERGSRDAIMSQMQPGSGASLAAQLSNQQSAANQMKQQGLDIAAGSRLKALQALAQMGNVAGQMRGQSFNEQATIGGAQDAIDRFNAQNSTANNQFNANAQNQASAQNQQNRLGAMQVAAGQGNQVAQSLYGQGDRRAAEQGAQWKQIGGIGGAASDTWAARQNQEDSGGTPTPPPMVQANPEDEWADPFKK